MSGLYLHIPFCKRKCLYCDFCSFEKTDLITEFLKAIPKEIELRLFPKFNIETVYIGGGTPSILKEKEIEKLFEIVRNKIDLSKVKEITFEANPESLNLEKAKLLLSLGVNRISLGAQSFNEEKLKYLGRLASVEQFESAFENLIKAGFENINIDLIYGIPNQTVDEWDKDLEYVKNLNPQHISCYCLEIHRGTPLWQDREKISDEEQEKMYFLAIEKLRKMGYAQYEISNFSKPGKKSLHNLNYWLRGNYIGFGPSAASCINEKRMVNSPQIDKYLHKLLGGLSPEFSQETLSQEDIYREKLMLGLRLSDGIEYNGDIFIKFKDKIVRAIEKGFLETNGNRVKIKERFLFVSNSIISEIIF